MNKTDTKEKETITLEEVKVKLANGNLSHAIKDVLEITNQSDLHRYAISISSAYNTIRREKIKNIISDKEVRLQESKLCDHLLNLIHDIEISETKDTNKKARVQLIIEGKLDDFSESDKEKLVSILSVILETDKEKVKILNVVSGSVKLTIELTEQQAKKMIQLFENKDKSLNALTAEFELIQIRRDNTNNESLKSTIAKNLDYSMLQNKYVPLKKIYKRGYSGPTLIRITEFDIKKIDEVINVIAENYSNGAQPIILDLTDVEYDEIIYIVNEISFHDIIPDEEILFIAGADNNQFMREIGDFRFRAFPTLNAVTEYVRPVISRGRKR